jgi:hypothetical protein
MEIFKALATSGRTNIYCFFTLQKEFLLDLCEANDSKIR